MNTAAFSEKIDLQMLRLLQLLNTNQSLSKTAAELNLSPSKASRVLSDAREIFGDQLFYRSSAWMYPTKKMMRMMPRIEAALADITGLIGDADTCNITEMESVIRIEATDNVFSVCVAPFMDELSRALPKLKIEVVAPTGNGIEELRNAEIDFLIGFDPRLAIPSTCHTMTLLRAPHIFGLRKGNPLRKKLLKHFDDPSNLEFLADCELVVIPVRTASGKRAPLLPPWHDQVRNVLSTPYFLSAASVVAHSNRIMLIPAPLGQILEEDGLIDCVPLQESVVEWEPRMIWHDDTDKSTLHQFFRATLISAMKRKFPTWFVGA